VNDALVPFGVTTALTPEVSLRALRPSGGD
jgi:hypothetical protein